MADPRETSVPFIPPVRRLRPDEFDASIFEHPRGPSGDDRADPDEEVEGEEPPAQREGLPAGFRMRHDAHYVEELASRRHARRIHAEAARQAPKAFAEVGESLDAIAACLQLFRPASRPAPERVALDLIGAEVCRATWLVQALALLDDDPPVANAPVDLFAVAERVARASSMAGHRADVTIDGGARASGLRARGDEPLLTVAVAGVVMALQAVAERVEGAGVVVLVRDVAPDSVTIEAAQEAVRLPASWRTRFLDPQWIDRPGGRRVAVALAAAERIAALHRGTLTLEHAEAGGCRLVLSLPRA